MYSADENRDALLRYGVCRRGCGSWLYRILLKALVVLTGTIVEDGKETHDQLFDEMDD